MKTNFYNEDFHRQAYFKRTRFHNWIDLQRYIDKNCMKDTIEMLKWNILNEFVLITRIIWQERD